MFKRYAIFIVFFFFIFSNAHANNILILGDSLSAGYGIDIEDSWPALLQDKLNQQHAGYTIHNASISGQTTAEGVAQIDGLLASTSPAIVILELGANDGLRGLSIKAMTDNLKTMIEKSQKVGAKVLLLGIRVPVNYGERYGRMFEASFTSLATNHQTEIVPFMLAPLEKVITPKNRIEYIQPDGLHPTVKAQPLLLDHIYKGLKPLL